MSQALLGRYAATVWGVCVWNHPDFQIHSLSSWNDYAGDLQLLGSTRYTYKFFGSSEFEILNADTELLWWNLGMRQWVKKKGASVPASTGCDDNCCCCWWKCPEIGDWELLLYCICDYIPSPSLYILFFPLPETPTCEHTLWKWKTQSSLPSGRMKPTSSLLSSMNKNLLILPECLQSFSPFVPQRPYPASL